MNTLFKKAMLLIAAVTLAGSALSAQEMNSLMFRKPVKSPEVTEEGITFRFKAPKARKVQVSASWLGYNPANA